MNLLDSLPATLVVRVGNALIACDNKSPTRTSDAVDGYRGDALVDGAIKVIVKLLATQSFQNVLRFAVGLKPFIARKYG